MNPSHSLNPPPLNPPLVYITLPIITQIEMYTVVYLIHMVPFLPITILTIEVVHCDLWHLIASCHLSFNRWHIGWPATGITGRSMRDQYLNTRWRDSYKFPLICLPLMSLFRPPEIFLSFISPPTLYGSWEKQWGYFKTSLWLWSING